MVAQVNFTFDIRGAPREHETKITIDVFVKALRIFCSPKDFLDLRTILGSFASGPPPRHSEPAAAENTTAARAVDDADGSCEVKLHIVNTVVALVFSDFETIPHHAENASKFVSGEDPLGISYLKASLFKTTVAYRTQNDAARPDTASVEIVGANIIEMWCASADGSSDTCAVQNPVLEVGTASKPHSNIWVFKMALKIVN